MKTFRISFSGATLPGVDRDAAKRGLAQFYRLKSTAGLDRFFSGKKVTLRRNLAKDDAAQLYVTLRKLGLDIRIEPEPQTTVARKHTASSEATSPNDISASGSGSVDSSTAPEPAQATVATSDFSTTTPATHESSAHAESMPASGLQSRRKRQPGAPNLFDIRPAGEVKATAPQDDYRMHAARVVAGVLAIAFLFVALRFAVMGVANSDKSTVALTVTPQGQPQVLVDNVLLRHDRSGFAGAVQTLTSFSAGELVDWYALDSNNFVLLRAPFTTPLPPWLAGWFGLQNASGRLERCELGTSTCTLLREGLDQASLHRETGRDTWLLADRARSVLLRLTTTGESLANAALPLTAPTGLWRHDGLLYLVQGGVPEILVLKPDAAEFGAVLERIELDGVSAPITLARTATHWWLLDQQGGNQMLLRLDDTWRVDRALALPVGSQVKSLQPWNNKLLLADSSRGQIYRVAEDGELESPFSEEAISELLEAGETARAEQRSLQVLVLVLLFLLITALLAFASFKSLQHKLYRADLYPDQSFDITDERIQWLDPAPDPSPHLRKVSLGLLLAAPLSMFIALLTPASPAIMIAISLVMLGLAGFSYALQQSVGCHLGLVDEQLVLVDHRRTYRIGQGPNVQYVSNFIMIDDVVVYLGNRLLPLFDEGPLRERFEPVVTRGIRVDNTTLRVKLIDQRHPLFYGSLALLLSAAAATLLVVAG